MQPSKKTRFVTTPFNTASVFGLGRQCPKCLQVILPQRGYKPVCATRFNEHYRNCLPEEANVDFIGGEGAAGQGVEDVEQSDMCVMEDSQMGFEDEEQVRVHEGPPVIGSSSGRGGLFGANVQLLPPPTAAESIVAESGAESGDLNPPQSFVSHACASIGTGVGG